MEKRLARGLKQRRTRRELETKLSSRNFLVILTSLKPEMEHTLTTFFYEICHHFLSGLKDYIAKSQCKAPILT